jgi:hypothetical protein
MKRLFVISSLSLMATLLAPVVSAQSSPGLAIQPISIPVFIAPDPNFSIFSWIAFFGAIATIGIIIYWIFLILQAALIALKSDGKPEGLEEAGNRMKSIFTGAAITLFFPILLTIIGGILGIGSIFDFPRMLRECSSGQYDYYFQAFLAQDGNNAVKDADNICF